jgi:hypothetical protein
MISCSMYLSMWSSPIWCYACPFLFWKMKKLFYSVCFNFLPCKSYEWMSKFLKQVTNMTTIYCWPLELLVNKRLQCKHLLPSLLSFVLITFWSIYACTKFFKLMQFFLNFLVELWLHRIYLKLTKTLQISCSVFF